MENKNLSRFFTTAFVAIVLAVTASCSKMDDYKSFVKDGEISYTAKVDSFEVFSGKGRVQIKGIIRTDPKITSYKVFWNNRKDSLVAPFNKTQNVDTIKNIITGLEENIYNFEIITFDSFGNRSVSVFAVGKVFGTRYQNSIFNRPIVNRTLAGSKLTINFASMDLNSGVFESELEYTNTAGVLTKVKVPISQSQLIINDFKATTSFTYRTAFLPDATSIDVFYSDYTTIKP